MQNTYHILHHHRLPRPINYHPFPPCFIPLCHPCWATRQKHNQRHLPKNTARSHANVQSHAVVELVRTCQPLEKGVFFFRITSETLGRERMLLRKIYFKHENCWPKWIWIDVEVVPLEARHQGWVSMYVYIYIIPWKLTYPLKIDGISEISFKQMVPF